MAQAPDIRRKGSPSFHVEHDPRGFYVHRYDNDQVLLADSMLPGARHLHQLYAQTGQKAKVLLLSPDIRQVGTHLGPQLFGDTADLFQACAWVLPDHLPMIVSKELTRHINEMFPFDIFRYRPDAEDWLIRQP